MYWIIGKDGLTKTFMARESNSFNVYMDGEAVLSVLVSPNTDQLTEEQRYIIELAEKSVSTALEVHNYVFQKLEIPEDRCVHCEEILDEPDSKCEQPRPIGKCSGCGTPVYSIEGFCGVCRPG